MDNNANAARGEVVSDHYLQRSWSMLTAERGWYKPMLVLAVAQFVPVLGWLGTEGYALEWGRLTAWRVDAHPKQKNVQIGKVLSSGWRGFVVALGWSAALALVYWAFWGLTGGARPTNDGARTVLNVIYTIVALVAAAVICVAELRATVYQRLGTGFRLDRIFQMCKADFGGLMRMVGMRLLGVLIKGVVALVFIPIALGTVLPPILDLVFNGTGYGMMSTLALHELLANLSGLIPVVLIMLYLISLVGVVFRMLCTTGVALWMRKFDVAHWGKSSDPLPPTLSSDGDAGVVPPSGFDGGAQPAR